MNINLTVESPSFPSPPIPSPHHDLFNDEIFSFKFISPDLAEYVDEFNSDQIFIILETVINMIFNSHGSFLNPGMDTAEDQSLDNEANFLSNGVFAVLAREKENHLNLEEYPDITDHPNYHWVERCIDVIVSKFGNDLSMIENEDSYRSLLNLTVNKVYTELYTYHYSTESEILILNIVG